MPRDVPLTPDQLKKLRDQNPPIPEALDVDGQVDALEKFRKFAKRNSDAHPKTTFGKRKYN